jgi:hypothetical protein
MAQLTCPTCKLSLDVEEGVQGRWLTCPRCLTLIGAIHTGVTEAPAPRPVADSRERREGWVCASCGRDVDRLWRFCPFCEESLRQTRRPPGVPQIELDVRRDIGTIHIIALVLGGLLVTGALGFCLFGGMEGAAKSVDSTIAAIVILVFVLIAGLAALAFGSRSKVVYAISGVAGGWLVAGATALIVVVLVVAVMCAVIGAAFNIFFNACQFKSS